MPIAGDPAIELLLLLLTIGEGELFPAGVGVLLLSLFS